MLLGQPIAYLAAHPDLFPVGQLEAVTRPILQLVLVVARRTALHAPVEHQHLGLIATIVIFRFSCCSCWRFFPHRAPAALRSDSDLSSGVIRYSSGFGGRRYVEASCFCKHDASKPSARFIQYLWQILYETLPQGLRARDRRLYENYLHMYGLSVQSHFFYRRRSRLLYPRGAFL